jgi:formimidoylglutamate deiminase
VRAVPRDWLEALAGYARRHDLILHVHADEQPDEIRICLDEHGLRPIELLAETGFLGPRTTVVHATHADDRELDLLAEQGAGICVCPTTEGNLGDGFLPAEGVLRRRIRLSIGSDQHVRLDPFEELRELETNARRLARRRNVLVDDGDDSPAPYLLRAGWRQAALTPGAPADFIEIDLTHRDLGDVAPEHLTAALIFGAGRDVVAATYVDGAPVYRRDG